MNALHEAGLCMSNMMVHWISASANTLNITNVFCMHSFFLSNMNGKQLIIVIHKAVMDDLLFFIIVLLEKCSWSTLEPLCTRSLVSS